jgi:hypothetical protein
MKRIARDLQAAMREAFPDAVIEILRGRRHYKVVVMWRGRRKTCPFSCSPRDHEHAVWNTVKQVQRAMAEPPGRN